MKKFILSILLLLGTFILSNVNAQTTRFENGVKSVDKQFKIQSQSKAATSLALNLPKVLTFDVNGIQFTMIFVEHGTFQMGSINEPIDPNDVEKPVHQVTLTNNYYIGQTEVTQSLWQAVMGGNPSNFKGPNRPVEQVSWNDCQSFINKLRILTCKKFRLPTEAEWEYAARGGNNAQGCQYSGSDDLSNVAWYTVNSYDKGSNSSDYGTHPVGTKDANELGIYDMSGNVWEWCQDYFDSYSSASQTNPVGASSGFKRVLRGGGWNGCANGCRSTFRSWFNPDRTTFNLGFRLCLSE